MVILIFIVVDAIIEQILGKSLMTDHHFSAMRVLDLILSISVFLQSWIMEKLLEEKDEIHLKQGYAKGRLTSPFILMRRKQLQLIACSFITANMLVIAELVTLFGIKDPTFNNCARLCAQPYSNGASIYLLVLSICHLVPSHLFLYSFYIIPRRFYASAESEDMKLVKDLGTLETPLLNDNLSAVGESMTWQMDRDL